MGGVASSGPHGGQPGGRALLAADRRGWRGGDTQPGRRIGWHHMAPRARDTAPPSTEAAQAIPSRRLVRYLDAFPTVAQMQRCTGQIGASGTKGEVELNGRVRERGVFL